MKQIKICPICSAMWLPIYDYENNFIKYQHVWTRHTSPEMIAKNPEKYTGIYATGDEEILNERVCSSPYISDEGCINPKKTAKRGDFDFGEPLFNIEEAVKEVEKDIYD